MIQKKSCDSSAKPELTLISTCLNPKTRVTYCTCHRVELVALQNDGEHEDELRAALRKRLHEPQHAEVVAQVHREALSLVDLCAEAAYGELEDTCVPGTHRKYYRYHHIST